MKYRLIFHLNKWYISYIIYNVKIISGETNARNTFTNVNVSGFILRESLGTVPLSWKRKGPPKRATEPLAARSHMVGGRVAGNQKSGSWEAEGAEKI